MLSFKRHFQKLKEDKAVDSKEKAIESIDSIIKTCQDEVIVYCRAVDFIEGKYGKISAAEEVATIFPYIMLSMIDIMLLHKMYLKTEDEVEKNLICRTAAQHMYEFLEKGSAVLGYQSNAISKKFSNEKVGEKLKSVRKSFNDLKKKYHNELKELRHNVSGHKNRDIRKQIQLSNSIKIIDFQEKFILFIFFFGEVVNLKKLIAGKIGKIAHI